VQKCAEGSFLKGCGKIGFEVRQHSRLFFDLFYLFQLLAPVWGSTLEKSSTKIAILYRQCSGILGKFNFKELTFGHFEENQSLCVSI